MMRWRAVDGTPTQSGMWGSDRCRVGVCILRVSAVIWGN